MVKRLSYAALEQRLLETRMEADEVRRMRAADAQAREALTEHLAEVKERLAFAEAELQRMAGYIQRVQEDDIVREELVAVGDPAGEQQLVPKRKPTPFAGVGVVQGQVNAITWAERDRWGEEKKRATHWVNY